MGKTEKKKIEVGKKNDFILVITTKGSHIFGKLEDIVSRNTVERELEMGLNEKMSNREYLKFDGDSYYLVSTNVMGKEFPGFVKRAGTYGIGPPFYSGQHIERVISGLDNITFYLESHPNQKYREHANLVRKIAEIQKEARK